MALTRAFKESVQNRANRDSEFREALLREALDCMLAGDLDTGKIVLRDYINATIGFSELAVRTNKQPKSLMRMFSSSGNPRAVNLFEVIHSLAEHEHLHLHVTAVR